jgi:hypothetical protein
VNSTVSRVLFVTAAQYPAFDSHLLLISKQAKELCPRESLRNRDSEELQNLLLSEVQHVQLFREANSKPMHWVEMTLYVLSLDPFLVLTPVYFTLAFLAIHFLQKSKKGSTI